MSRVTRCFLPYFDERPDTKIKALVLHCSTHGALEMLDVLRENKLSAHYIIDVDGKVYQPVSEQKRAWHAGVSRWRDMDNLNHYSIGIELTSPSMGQHEYAKAQIDSLTVLARQIIHHYQIPAVNVVAHSDIAPIRKPDPGAAFPWQKLAKKGIGLWYDIADADKVAENNVEKLLSTIGYDTSDIAAASYAFCRHFVPEEIAEKRSIKEVIENVYPADFNLPEQYLPILKACAYKYSQFNTHHD